MEDDFKPCLVVLTGQHVGEKHEIGVRLTMGRHSTSDLQLNDDKVSRHHAEIEATDKGWIIRDLGSQNGTSVNDHKISGEHLLVDGDLVRLGRTQIKFLSVAPDPTHWRSDGGYVAAFDGLTQATTKRFFLKRLSDTVDAGGPVAIAVFELVHFSDVNDTVGFRFGDAVLRDFAGFLMASVDGAEVGRIGGQEFAVWIQGDIAAINALAFNVQMSMVGREFGEQETALLKCWIGTADNQGPLRPASELYAEAKGRLGQARDKTLEVGPLSKTLSPFVLVSNHPNEVFELRYGDSQMGRSSNCEIQLKSSMIARSHARVTVSFSGVVLADHNSTNGVFLSGERMLEPSLGALSRANLELGDVFQIGEFSFELSLAPWLVVEPPADLLVQPQLGVENLWAERHIPGEWNDALWVAYYLRWRAFVVTELMHQNVHEDDYHWPIAALGQMCSPMVLQWICDLLIEQDNRAWFLGYRDPFIEALAAAEHGMGPLTAYEILREHPEQDARDTADAALRKLAQADGLPLATSLLDRVPPLATDISALISRVLTRARCDRDTWTAARFNDYMARSSFALAAEDHVFSVWLQDTLVDTFRPSDGALLTLDDMLTLEPGHMVRVADPQNLDDDTRERWQHHLADFEVVQRFPQF